MDEERLEVLALLEGRSDHSRRSSSITSAGRSTSPYSRNPRSPMRSPMQSILDYDDLEAPPTMSNAQASNAAAAPRQSPPRPVQPIRSMLDIEPARPTPIRSMLDIDSPPVSTIQPVFSAQSSPTEPNHRVHPPGTHHRHGSGGSSGVLHHPRSMSDATGRPADFGPRAHQTRGERSDPTAGYQFSDIITNRESPMLAKRTGLTSSHNANTTKRGANSMAEVMRGTDVSNLKLPGHTLPLHGRNSLSGARPPPPKSRSPHNRLGMRTKSPHTGLNTRALSPAGAAFLADSHYDMQNAYRRLSDLNIMRSGGSLSELPMRGTNGGRLKKDYISPDGEELLEDSSEDNHSSSSDEEGEHRGRKAARSFSDDKSPQPSESPVDSRKAGQQTLSLLAAAEEERKCDPIDKA